MLSCLSGIDLWSKSIFVNPHHLLTASSGGLIYNTSTSTVFNLIILYPSLQGSKDILRTIPSSFCLVSLSVKASCFSFVACPEELPCPLVFDNACSSSAVLGSTTPSSSSSVGGSMLHDSSEIWESLKSGGSSLLLVVVVVVLLKCC